ncbi:MAG: hypothetical protein AB1801_01575 [Chloroflexota bacterium]
MRCPKCGSNRVAEDARYCQNCGTPAIWVDIDVKENLGRVIGVQTEVIQGNVYGKDIFEVQLYVLSEAGRRESWDRFIKENTPPYKGLYPYTAQDKVLFKGRDQEIDRVVAQIGEQPLLVVYGQAGVGKTSLLAAGVIPKLVESGALVVDIPDYRQPVKAFRAALAANAEQIPISLPDDLTLPALLQAVEEEVQGTLILVFDQFESLFEPSVDPEHRTAFIKELGESLQTIEPEFLRVIIAVREEALSRLAELQDHLPDLLRSPFHLLPFNTGPQAKAAIEEPLKVLKYPVSFVGNLIDQFLVPDLDDLSREMPGQIFPPHLQIVCRQLYQEARQRHPPQIDSKLYDGEMKGAEGIMARYLEDTLQTQLADDRPLAVRVLTVMASPGVESWVSSEQLPLNGDPPERLPHVLERLVKAELLASRPADGWYEYAFASQSVAIEARRLEGPEAERRYQARDELELIWRAWLARNALATRGQLRHLARTGRQLTPRAVQALFLLRSAVTRDEPVGPWLAWLRSDEGYGLIRQLVEPNVANLTQYSSRSDLKRAESLLGLPDVTLPKRLDDQQGPFGPVAWSAVSHPDPIVRQTAALALTSLPHHIGLNNLDEALRDGLQGRRRRRRRAELYGTLADGDPGSEIEIKKRYSDLPFLDRISLWLWRARRRVFRDRDRVAWLTVGGAIGAGLGLGLLRAVIEALAPNAPFVGIQFAMYFYWGAMLGAFLSLGMTLAEPLLLSRPEKSGETPAIWRAPLHPDHLPAVVAAALGTLFFWLGHAIITFFICFPSLSNIMDPLRAPMVLVTGLGLSVALYGQPRISQGRGNVHWLLRPSTALRLATAALSFVLVEWVFIAKGEGTCLNIAFGKDLYKMYFLDYIMTRHSQLGDWIPHWPEYLALLDAALVGLVLTIGLTAGLVLAANGLARWRNLVERAGD